MRPDTIRRLEEYFETSPLLLGHGPVSYAEIDAAEEELGIKLTDAYREFIHRYGGGVLGSYPVFGLRRVEVMDDEAFSVVVVTAQFRTDGWPYTEGWAVISMDLAGNPIGLTTAGEVWVFDHDSGESVKLADTFEEFVLERLSE